MAPATFEGSCDRQLPDGVSLVKSIAFLEHWAATAPKWHDNVTSAGQKSGSGLDVGSIFTVDWWTMETVGAGDSRYQRKVERQSVYTVLELQKEPIGDVGDQSVSVKYAFKVTSDTGEDVPWARDGFTDEKLELEFIDDKNAKVTLRVKRIADFDFAAMRCTETTESSVQRKVQQGAEQTAAKLCGAIQGELFKKDGIFSAAPMQQQMPTLLQTPTPGVSDAAPTVAEQIKQLAELKEQGLIDAEEFKKAKQEILGRKKPSK